MFHWLRRFKGAIYISTPLISHQLQADLPIAREFLCSRPAVCCGKARRVSSLDAMGVMMHE